MKYNTDLTDLCVRHPYTSIPSKGLACVAGGIVSAREIKFWTSERRSREENGERDSEIFQSPSPHSPRGFAARLSKTLFRGRLQYRQLRRLLVVESEGVFGLRFDSNCYPLVIICMDRTSKVTLLRRIII